jgi:hypothetical protein
MVRGSLQSGQQPAQPCFIWEHDPDNGTAICALMRTPAKAPNELFFALRSEPTLGRSGSAALRRRMSTPMRRIRSGCCARAASGQVAAAPPSSVMNWRRLRSGLLPATRCASLPQAQDALEAPAGPWGRPESF